VVLFGTPLSTFTRTIAMALHSQHVPFQQIPCLPHSEEARKHHPLGFIPILQHRPAAIPSSSEPSPAIFEVYESAAILATLMLSSSPLPPLLVLPPTSSPAYHSEGPALASVLASTL